MSFITDAQLKARVEGLLKVESGTLYTSAPYWQAIVEDSRVAAYNEIVSAMATRGYTIGQIDSWDRGAEFEKDLGLFWSLVKGAGLHGYDDKFIARLDRREELKTVPITIGYEVADPAGASGEVSHGEQDRTYQQFKYQVDENGNVTRPAW